MRFILKITYPIFFLISLIFPRNKKLWVFGCYDGFVDNTSYFYEYSTKKGVFKCIWLANNEHELAHVQLQGGCAVLKNSFLGYWYSSRAGFSFICTGYSDVNRELALFSKVINFWHGTPIKKVYLDSQHDLNRFGKSKASVFISTLLMKFLTGRICFYYASNKIEREIVCKAANIPSSRSLATGAPRFDKMKNIKSEAVDKLLQNGKKYFLFAPTWREGGVWDDSYRITSSDYEKLNNILMSKNTVLIVKPHPLTRPDEIKSWGLKPSDNIRYSTDLGVNDINLIYSVSDLLITDVSSSMFDYLIFNKPVILFMPDKMNYVSGVRGIYEYFLETLNDFALIQWGQLIESLENPRLEIPILKNIATELHLTRSSNEVIYTDILRRFYGIEND